MSKEVNLELSVKRVFGPPIGQTSIPKYIIDKLNNFVDNEIDKDGKLSTKLDHGAKLAGQVKQEIRIPDELVKPDLFSFLFNITKFYIKSASNKEITKFELIDSWIVRQFQNEYNPIHYHNGHISGAGYIKLPESFGESIQENKKTNPNGNIVFAYGVKQFLANGTKTFKPQVGDFFIFPNYLYHSVNPFFGKGERRSISFNAFIDESIYDVYSNE